MIRYSIFKKFGRISTNKCTTECIRFENEDSAVDAFQKLFLKLTGNDFGAKPFEKKPGKYQLLDIKFDGPKKVLENLVESRLDPSVYELMKVICDEKAMKVNSFYIGLNPLTSRI